MLASARVAALVPVSDLEAAVGFYEETLGLKLAERHDFEEYPEAEFDVDGGRLNLYRSDHAGKAGHTLAGFRVADLDATMSELRGRGVRFEDYDLPGLKTEDGVARLGDVRACWFKDLDGNILAIDERG